MSNLSREQFNKSHDIETSQRRAQMRRGLGSGFVGVGQNWQAYPAYTSTLQAGSLVSSTASDVDSYPAQAVGDDAMGLGTANGLGEGGTAASGAGAAGGSPA